MRFRAGEQWDSCGVCGTPWPSSQLTVQLGVKRCPRDIDNLDNFNREEVIAEHLAQNKEEATDRRDLDLQWWADQDEVR